MERTTVANHFERNQKLMLYVGIDIAKNKHDVACINQNGEAVISKFRFDNSYQGFNQLKQKLEQLSPITQDVKIALESTGHLVKSGFSHLRHALIQAAKLLSIYSPHFKAYLRLKISQEKHYTVAVTHVQKSLFV
ncbi:IS110 family transposase [Streptococcus canis]|uniref:IS110 family transposase n=1 Tax=Streptococcus canis TaxID=1329 RepID=UPI002AA1A7D5|nr:hypothetical protein SpKU43_03900 [Streptococcus canis]